MVCVFRFVLLWRDFSLEADVCKHPGMNDSEHQLQPAAMAVADGWIKVVQGCVTFGQPESRG